MYNKNGDDRMNTLKELRLENHYSLADMSEMLGICKTFYWQIENKKRRLSYEMAIKIADIFHKKPDEIFYDDIKKRTK